MTRELVEAAKAVIADRNHLGAMFEWEGNDVLTSPNALRWQAFVAALRAALSAYDSAPAPSEDRVREAAGRCVRALLMDSRCTEGDRLAIKKRGSDGNEHDLGAWSHDAALNVIAEALRPYVTPAPALPAGTVAVEVSLLKRWRVAMSRCIATNGSPTHNLSLPEIDAILQPPPRPEPSAGLVEEWKAAARAESDKAYDAKLAALRAAWEADPKGKQ